jgi:glutamine synthetase
MDGVEHRLDPGPLEETPYESDRPLLPRSLMESVAALRDDALFRSALGDRFIDYVVALKESEIGRFLGHVTDWEQREYFEIF